MAMSAAELKRQRNLYHRAVQLRLLIAASVMLSILLTVALLSEYRFRGAAVRPGGTCNILLAVTLIVADVAGFMAYVSHTIKTLQARYGFVCSVCHAYLEWQVGKLRVKDGKCLACGATLCE